MSTSRKAPTPPGPVTVLATRSARAGREREFAASLERLRDILADQPGHQDTAILAPLEASGEAVVLYRFDGPDSLRAWQASHARKAQLEASAALTQAPPHERSVSALDGWFVSTGGRVLRAPPRWKTWVLSCAAIWVLLTLISLTTAPLLAELPLPVRFALIVPLLGAAMTWLVMPALTRLLRGWLHGR